MVAQPGPTRTDPDSKAGVAERGLGTDVCNTIFGCISPSLEGVICKGRDLIPLLCSLLPVSGALCSLANPESAASDPETPRPPAAASAAAPAAPPAPQACKVETPRREEASERASRAPYMTAIREQPGEFKTRTMEEDFQDLPPGDPTLATLLALGISIGRDMQTQYQVPAEEEAEVAEEKRRKNPF